MLKKGFFEAFGDKDGLRDSAINKIWKTKK